MPLKSGKSQKTISKNISEFHGGKTYAKTAAKFGKEKADKQAVAVALDKARGDMPVTVVDSKVRKVK